MVEFPDIAILPNLYLTTAIGKALVKNGIIGKEEIITNLQNMIPKNLNRESDRSRLNLAEIQNVISAVENW